MIADLDPSRVRREPELAALSVPDAALMAARTALTAQHPEADTYGLYSSGPMPPLLLIAALLVDRTAELRCLLTRY
jgi:hypothetical protein